MGTGPLIIEPILSYERLAGSPPHSFLLYFCLTDITENTESASDIRLMYQSLLKMSRV